MIRLSESRGFEWLERHGVPTFKAQASGELERTFEGGGHFGIEVPVVNSLKQFQDLARWFKEYDLPLSQINETLGASLLPEKELTEMLAFGRENGIGVTLSCTPRPEYDRQASFYRTGWGKEQGRRINNTEALAFCLDEAIRVTELGARGIIAYDLGVFRMMNQARQEGILPQDLVLKASTHCAVTNPFVAEIYVENGVDDIILPHDLSLEMMSAIRAKVPGATLSILTDSYGNKGGFIRFFEVNDIIRLGAPLFLKTGSSVIHDPYSVPTPGQSEACAKRVRAMFDHIDFKKNDFTLIGAKSPIKALPV